MNNLWNSTVGALSPAVRFLICVLAVVGLASVAAEHSAALEKDLWMPLTGPDFWRGEYWRLVTYPLLPAGFYELLMNCVMIAWLGSSLERSWGTRQFVTYCLIVVIASGSAVIFLWPSNPQHRLAGLGSLDFGLLAGWAWINRSGLDATSLVSQPSMTHVALLTGGISLLMGCFRGGVATTLTMVAGALAGVFYLFILSKLASRPGLVASPDGKQTQETAQAGRISRLEL